MPAPLLAPRWHTTLLVAVLVLVAVLGTLLSRRPVAPSPAPTPVSGNTRILAIYLPMLVVQSGLALYVCRIGRPRNALPALIGERWSSFGRACVDVTLAASGWLLLLGFEMTWARLFGATGSPAVAALLPVTWTERIAWLVVSLCVGFSEEVVYRGYLLTQLTAFTGHAPLALALQAVLFGIAHGEQGPSAVLRLTLYGLAFGALARWRRSLLPGIACHTWTNLASGLFRA